MAKGSSTIKLRISRLINSSFQSCRSKHPSNLPHDPVPSFLHLDFPSAKPHRSSFNHHFTSVGCGCGTASLSPHSSGYDTAASPEFKWQQNKKWHVIAKVYDEVPRQKIYNSSASGGSDHELFRTPTLPPPYLPAIKNRRTRRKKKLPKFRISTSTPESGIFSSEGDSFPEETETLVSSRSFSTNASSEFNPQLQTITEIPISRRRKQRKPKRSYPVTVTGFANTGYSKSVSRSSTDGEFSPERLSVFRKWIPHSAPGSVKDRKFPAVQDAGGRLDDGYEVVYSLGSFLPEFETGVNTPISRSEKQSRGRGANTMGKEKIFLRSSVSSSTEVEMSPARLSVFRKLIPCTVQGKVKESYAVVKKSEDPLEDFKRSMMEMIMEKQMFEDRELEDLLECFLSLNSREHHGIIVEAFAEIWEALFGCASVSSCA